MELRGEITNMTKALKFEENNIIGGNDINNTLLTASKIAESLCKPVSDLNLNGIVSFDSVNLFGDDNLSLGELLAAFNGNVD